jgi:Zn-dependent peptidase ImmA (M78 family)
MIVRRKYIQNLASNLIAKSKTDRPPVPVESIAREKGVIVSKRRVESNVSGFLYRNASKRRPVIGVNIAHHPNRQRFTIAHELGHFLLHAGDVVHVDDPVNHRDERSGQGTDVQEVESNLFAAELLMPVQFLREDLQRFGTLDLLDEQKVESLARKYGVSNQAMAVRLSYLGYLAI